MKTIYNDVEMIRHYLSFQGEDEFFERWLEYGLMDTIKKAEELELPYIAECDLDSGFLEQMLREDNGCGFEIVLNENGIVVYKEIKNA